MKHGCFVAMRLKTCPQTCTSHAVNCDSGWTWAVAQDEYFKRASHYKPLAQEIRIRSSSHRACITFAPQKVNQHRLCLNYSEHLILRSEWLGWPSSHQRNVCTMQKAGLPCCTSLATAKLKSAQRYYQKPNEKAVKTYNSSRVWTYHQEMEWLFPSS